MTHPDRPVLGMMVWPNRISKLRKQRPTPTIAMIAQACEIVGMRAYFFGLREVNLRKNRIRGWYRNEQGRWVSGMMPWPDVLYQARKTSGGPKSKGKRVRNRLLGKAAIINPVDVLGKWEVASAVMQCPELAGHLPETRLYREESDMLELLKRHGSVLAKQRYGLGGAHMSRIRLRPDGSYDWQNSSADVQATALEFAGMLQRVKENAVGPFVVQQELDLLAVSGRRNVIRIIMCKDGRGRWQQGIAYLLLGGKEQFAVNRHQGGEQFPLPIGLRKLGLNRGQIRETSQQLGRVAQLTVSCIDEHLVRMGEIGLDLAVDKDLHVWVLEANARPHKDNLPFRSSRAKMRPFLLLTQYARFLHQQHQSNG